MPRSSTSTRWTILRTELDRMIRDHANRAGVAVLTAPLDIGWGRKAPSSG